MPSKRPALYPPAPLSLLIALWLLGACSRVPEADPAVSTVREARAIRARQAELEQQVGSLDTDGVSRATFAAHLDGDDVRMIEFRISRDDTVLRETRDYFAGRDDTLRGRSEAAGIGGRSRIAGRPF